MPVPSTSRSAVADVDRSPLNSAAVDPICGPAPHRLDAAFARSCARPAWLWQRSFTLSMPAPDALLALGAERKSSLCFWDHGQAELCGLGDLASAENYRQYVAAVRAAASELRPRAVAHDLHPLYLSTCCAAGLGLPLQPVQHHHAHVAAVMAEQALSESMLGLVCDGSGYGSDGQSWGCELLHCHGGQFTRLGHLGYIPLLGGDAAAIDTWRPALALLLAALGPDWRRSFRGALAEAPVDEVAAMQRWWASGERFSGSSSLGRIFDAVSCLTGLCIRNSHEGQAAIALEHAAIDPAAEPYAYETTEGIAGIRMSVLPTIRGIVHDLSAGVTAAVVSARFHETLARMLSAAVELGVERTGIRQVVLAGGCFMNQRLRLRLVQRLQRHEIVVHLPQRATYGDEGLALGQAYVAAARLRGD